MWEKIKDKKSKYQRIRRNRIRIGRRVRNKKKKKKKSEVYGRSWIFIFICTIYRKHKLRMKVLNDSIIDIYCFVFGVFIYEFNSKKKKKKSVFDCNLKRGLLLFAFLIFCNFFNFFHYHHHHHQSELLKINMI